MFERETGGRRHFDGVRRSERVEEEESRELTVIDTRSAEIGRRFEAEKSKKDRMWTEITKDLVSLEAIKERGYEYEETEKYYYVMEYLRYVCLQLPLILAFPLYNVQAPSPLGSTFVKSRPIPYYVLIPASRKTFFASSKSPKTSNGTAANVSAKSKRSAKWQTASADR